MHDKYFKTKDEYDTWTKNQAQATGAATTNKEKTPQQKAIERQHINEVNNKLGNFINRTLKFKGLTNIPEGNMDENIKSLLERTYEDISLNNSKYIFL